MKRGVVLLASFLWAASSGAWSADCALSLPDYAYVQLSAYAGECRNGVADGQGRVQVEMWQHGQRIWTGVLDGNFSKGLPSGPGTFTSDDGLFRFEGTFRSGSMWEGKETRTRRDGTVFESEVRTGVPRQPKLASQSPAATSTAVTRDPASSGAAAESAAQSRAAGEMIGNKLADLLEGSIQRRAERRRADEQRRQEAARAAASQPAQQAPAPSQSAPVPQWEREQRAKQERRQKDQQEQYAKFQQQEKLRIAQAEIDNKARLAKVDQSLRELDARNKAASEKERQRAADLKAQTDRADRERQAQQEQNQKRQRDEYARFQAQETLRIAQAAADDKAKQAQYEQADRERAIQKKVLEQKEQQRLADLKAWDERDKRERQEQQKKNEQEQRERNAKADRAIKETEAKQKAANDKHQRELEDNRKKFEKQEKERQEQLAAEQRARELHEQRREAQEKAQVQKQRLAEERRKDQEKKEVLSKKAQMSLNRNQPPIPNITAAPLKAALLFRTGNGGTAEYEFDEIPLREVRAMAFPKLRDAVGYKCATTAQVIDDRASYMTPLSRPMHHLTLGNITLRLQGTLRKDRCEWEFTGTLKAYNDTWDLNRSDHRNLAEEILVQFASKRDGRPYEIRIKGERPVRFRGTLDGRPLA